MALTATPVGSVLQISVQTGTDTLGRPVIRKRVFNDLKTSLTDQQVYDLGVILAGLQAYPVTGNQRLNNVDLVNA